MDRREVNRRWWSSFDEGRMVLILEGAGPDNEDLEIPARYEVCGTCEGKGRHVNPSIDSNGLTASDFDEAGPDFFDDYMSGMYDVACNECGGERLVPEIDEERCDPATLKIARQWQEDHYQDQATQWAERRMGY